MELSVASRDEAVKEILERDGDKVEDVRVQPYRPGVYLVSCKVRGRQGERQGVFTEEQLLEATSPS